MSDAISRSEALKRIENFMHVAGGNAAVQMCYEIILNMPDIDIAPDWISVEERLPETDAWVAVWYMDKDGDCFPTVGAYRDGGNGLMYWETDVDINERAYPPEKVTHWMQLPNPPKK